MSKCYHLIWDRPWQVGSELWWVSDKHYRQAELQVRIYWGKEKKRQKRRKIAEREREHIVASWVEREREKCRKHEGERKGKKRETVVLGTRVLER